MSHSAYTPIEAEMHLTFMALMWALSYPGRVHILPVEGDKAFYAIADTLLDIETSFYTSDENLIPYFTRNGARCLTPEQAAYHFYPTLSEAHFDTVKQASIGTLVYPDQSATLIIGAQFGSGHLLTLTGPGIQPKPPTQIQVAGLPHTFWQLREKAIRYPRGWDVYLVDGQQVIGLPRTTLITLEE
jgi:alpha-D-ribose 1-methylphosphonate 5-triphosphate synthase subunit PhnH